MDLKLFKKYKELDEFITKNDDYIVVSKELPIISNLNMLENISLIKEVQEFMSIKDAQKLAREYLKIISYEYIADTRVNTCSDIEIFYVKYIRALFSDVKNIFLVTPFSMFQSTENIYEIINNLLKYETEKNILILDLYSNENKYKGSACNTIK